jgi:hypothetical protein
MLDPGNTCALALRSQKEAEIFACLPDAGI